MIALLLLSGGAGLVTEALAVLWVHFAERERGRELFVIALIQALAQVSGIVAIVSGWQGATAYVLGYACGPLLGLWLKRHMAASSSMPSVAGSSSTWREGGGL